MFCGIIKFCNGQLSWTVIFVQVHRYIISEIYLYHKLIYTVVCYSLRM